MWMLKGSLRGSVLSFTSDRYLCQVQTQTEISQHELRSTTSEGCFLNNMMNSTLAF